MNAYIFSTWLTKGKHAEMNRAAIEAGKNYSGTKWVVTVDYFQSVLVFAGSKEEAIKTAIDTINESIIGEKVELNTARISARNVTNCKKYSAE